MAELVEAVEGVSLEEEHAHNEGDHDSGVDETTQAKDIQQPEQPQANELKKSGSKASLPGNNKRSPTSPAKSPQDPAHPTKFNATSLTGSWSSNHSPTSPSKQKKVPMNKVQVGFAPSPNLKVVRSKIGSLENANYKPGGGNVKIETKKIQIEAKPRIVARNDTYAPGGGDKKQIQTVKLQWNAKSKIGSLENATHKPGGGDKKIETQKLDFKEKAKPKVGSTANLKHAPGGGNVKIYDDKEYLKQFKSGTHSKASSEGRASGTQVSSTPNTPVAESRDFLPEDPAEPELEAAGPEPEVVDPEPDAGDPEPEESQAADETADDQQQQQEEELERNQEVSEPSANLEDIPENPEEPSEA